MDAWDNEQLSDTIPGVDRVWAPSDVHQLRLYGTPIARIDNSKRVRKHQSVLAGKARADRQRTEIALRDGDLDSGIEKGRFTRLERHRLRNIGT